MNTQIVRPPKSPKPPKPPKPPGRGTFDALRPVLMAAALLGVLVGTALLAAWLTGPSSTDGFTLTVEAPTGGTLVGGGIECGTGGTSCATSVKDGQVVALRAEPDDGHVFGGYTLDCAPSGRLEMKADRRCGARFHPGPGSTPVGTPDPGGRRWPLTLTPPENGTIVTMEGHECGPTKKVCTAEVLEGTIVSLEVMPAPGYRVQSYTGDCVDGTANMTQARSCGVVLVPGVGASVEPTPRTQVPPSEGSRTARNEPRPGANDPRREPPAPAPQSVPPSGSPDKAPDKAPDGTPDKPSPASDAGPAPPRQAPPTPPATAAVPAGDKEAAEKMANTDIQRVLKAYRSAYERMDIPAMQRLQPAINVASHELQFKDVKTVKYTFGGDPQLEDLDVERGTVRAIAELKTENEHKSGKKQKPLEGKVTYLLKRIGESKDWQIVEVKYAMSPK